LTTFCPWKYSHQVHSDKAIRTIDGELSLPGSFLAALDKVYFMVPKVEKSYNPSLQGTQVAETSEFCKSVVLQTNVPTNKEVTVKILCYRGASGYPDFISDDKGQ
jgi:hypothetical protein